jgi:hypothetical protein
VRTSSVTAIAIIAQRREWITNRSVGFERMGCY